MLLQLIFALFLPFTQLRAPVLNEVKESPKFDTVIHPNKAVTDTGLFGSYNFVDNLIDIPTEMSSAGNVSLVFEDNSSNGFVSLSTTGDWYTTRIWSCYQIDIEWLNNGPYATVRFYVFDTQATTFDFIYNYGSSLVDNQSYFQDTIINFNVPFYLHGLESIVFNTLFTKDNNYLTTTYTGYYNFNLNLQSINTNVAVFGPITFDNQLFKLFTNKNNGVLGGSTQLLFLGYDLDIDSYVYSPYNLPFDTNLTVSQNLLLSGVKMSLTTYNNLSNVGVFNYVRDTSYDDTDFEDLLFTVADTPVYFISQFLSFELFGMNLFVALSGLITLIVVIFIIRKIA